MAEPPPVSTHDAAEPLRRQHWGDPSGSQAPRGSARLNRATRRPVPAEGLRAGSPEPDPAEARAVLAKAARRTGRWLGLTPEDFKAATGLPLDNDDAPRLESDQWTRCVALVRLGGRLELKLGRRAVARAWLRGRHLVLLPTPMGVLAGPGGPAALNDYLDAFER